MSTRELSLTRFWTPRYWPTWALWLALHIVARLPFAWLAPVGRSAGRILSLLKRREGRVAARNLQVCFPELDEAHRAQLLAEHFEAVGMSFVEMAIGWFWPIERLLGIVRIQGREHLEQAIAQGRGVLLVGAHLTTVEVGAAVLESLTTRCSAMYRPQRNAMIDVLLQRGRSRFAQQLIPRDDVRALLRSLRDNHVVMYLPDQTYLGRQSQMLPFFGEPALTNTATSKLARISGAIVLPYFFRRLPDDSGYVVDIGPPLPSFPTDDPAADTLRLVRRLEDYIRRAPEQYLWLYKKFKGRPAPYPDLYGTL